ncbi:MAG: hypothetical protein C4617_05840 [Candidatus Liberibacter europaeus]|uniref:Uncharacterized protein n=1 Tax=Candidatus Liberibacter europaeus TaxID=744859 RepID=A0A2T4VW76_9HYPH|nr:hypothetical protein [Candidatus Liberibacter europaeus]PTL86013.1 MAG: hypothetical protein C4617_05840 [Candidatus Liberibacter europaeus]
MLTSKKKGYSEYFKDSYNAFGDKDIWGGISSATSGIFSGIGTFFGSSIGAFKEGFKQGYGVEEEEDNATEDNATTGDKLDNFLRQESERRSFRPKSRKPITSSLILSGAYQR